MGIRSRIVKTLGGPVLTEVATEAVRRYAEASGGLEPDEAMWTRLTGSKRDLPQMTHERAIEVCYSLYQTNPLAHRITELMRDFIVGDGLIWSASNPEVAEVVGAFWDDPVNDLTSRVGDFALELGLYGELVPEAFVSEVAGVVQLGYIDPSQVKGVAPLPTNPLVLDKVKVKRKGDAVQGKSLEIIRERPSAQDATQIRLAGQTFYFQVNALSNSTRGWPDLLHLADWLDAFDQLLWEVLERARLVKTFVWDVELTGADDTMVQSYTRKYSTPPRSGSVRFHNEKEKWQAVAPQMGSYETAREADLILTHIAAGAGIPKTWLSQTDDVNRATAQVMDVPALRKLSRRQQHFVACIRRMVAFVLDEAIAAGRLAPELPVVEDEKKTTRMLAPIDHVMISAPEIAERDLPAVGKLLVDVSGALAVGEAEGWFGAAESRQALAGIFAQLGVDFDPKDVQADDDDDVPAEVEEAARRIGA